MDRSKIEWTDATWNPIRAMEARDGKLGWHCEHVSEGCRNCYAEAINRRLGTRLDFKPALLEDRHGHGAWSQIFLDEKMLTQPLRWKRPRRIFVGSMTDIFGHWVTDDMLDRLFTVMALSPQHTFQVLTKRPERAREYLNGSQSNIPLLGGMPLERIHFEASGHMEGDGGVMDVLKQHGNIYSLYCSVPWPLPNVWLGVSVEDQTAANQRIPILLDTPAALRFLSCEPLLGTVNLRRIRVAPDHHAMIDALDGYTIVPDGSIAGSGQECAMVDWVIAGGESGPGARPMHPDWVRSLRDQCQASGTPFLFKQWGNYLPAGQLQSDSRPWNPATGQTLHCSKKLAGNHLDGRQHLEWPEKH